eukprot:gnl/TRDRNA2_/TRDRNA2_100710_c0_seq2.p1 gnl/TRDRNA2_/TRDRNA2_100710_c0~~gnl/TRDRNA2_/TRDRNA2_100710_c0_seq2.p1  ORF type:complete len:382 (-),score=39.01 gnl/TRDRNA2_/TRDRNA2_100710_c0_seq2:89-1114(-)
MGDALVYYHFRPHDSDGDMPATLNARALHSSCPMLSFTSQRKISIARFVRTGPIPRFGQGHLLGDPIMLEDLRLWMDSHSQSRGLDASALDGLDPRGIAPRISPDACPGGRAGGFWLVDLPPVGPPLLRCGDQQLARQIDLLNKAPNKKLEDMPVTSLLNVDISRVVMSLSDTIEEVEVSQTSKRRFLCENSGVAPWPDGSYFGLRYGAQMGFTKGVSFPETGIGAGHQFHIDITAPDEPGLYTSIWALSTPAHEPYGPLFRIVINVSAATVNRSRAAEARDELSAAMGSQDAERLERAIFAASEAGLSEAEMLPAFQVLNKSPGPAGPLLRHIMAGSATP